MKRDEIAECLKRNHIPFEDLLPEKLEIYLQLLQEWNRRMDLTAVEEETEMLDRHFMDSLAVLRTDRIRSDASLIDVGTGAGFPGMPLKILYPEVEFVQIQFNCSFRSAFKTLGSNERVQQFCCGFLSLPVSC